MAKKIRPAWSKWSDHRNAVGFLGSLSQMSIDYVAKRGNPFAMDVIKRAGKLAEKVAALTEEQITEQQGPLLSQVATILDSEARLERMSVSAEAMGDDVYTAFSIALATARATDILFTPDEDVRDQVYDAMPGFVEEAVEKIGMRENDVLEAEARWRYLDASGRAKLPEDLQLAFEALWTGGEHAQANKLVRDVAKITAAAAKAE
jgi:hypothetical protein